MDNFQRPIDDSLHPINPTVSESDGRIPSVPPTIPSVVTPHSPQSEQTQAKVKRTPWVGLSLLMILCVALGGTVSAVVVNELNKHYYSKSAVGTQQSVTAQLKSEPTVTSKNDAGLLTPRQIGDKASAAVVAINTTTLAKGIFGNVGTIEGAGSGVLISADGYIVTNNHVIARSNTITVNLPSGKSLQAKVIGTDPTTDLAVIKVDAQNLPYLEMGNSAELHMGDQVVAIGNPLGELEGSLTVGYISATNRTVSVKEEDGTIHTMYGLLQTDAAINRGNSGGALIDLRGELIGINSVKTSAVGVEGLGFAIPTNTAKPIVEDLIKYGAVQDRPTLGITGLAIRPEMIQEYDYPQGVYVRSVQEGSAAEKAGIRKGDIITEVNGQRVASISDINGIKTLLHVGQEISIKIYRAGESLDMTLVLDAPKPRVPQSTQSQESAP